MKQVIAELVAFYDPDLLPGERYDVALIVVPIAVPPGYPPIAIRMAGLSSSVPSEQIETWVQSLKRVAATAAKQL